MATDRRASIPGGIWLGAWLGACAGGLAVAAMLVGQLVAGLPALIDVLGNGTVLLVPGPIFGALIDSLQERARPLLVVGTTLLILVISAALGAIMARWSWRAVASYPGELASRRGQAVWRWLLPALVLWVLTLPAVVVAEGTVATDATWTVLVDWLLISGLIELLLGSVMLGGTTAGVRTAGRPDLLTRRQFLVVTGAVAGVASLGYLGVRALRASSPPVGAAVGGSATGALPQGITPTSDFYVVSKDLFGTPQVNASTWRLNFGGREPFSLSYPDLTALAPTERIQTLECISNPVGGTLISNGSWSGVPLADLLSRAKFPSGTKEIVFGCTDGYTESLTLAEATAPTTLVVTHLNGLKLPDQHGFPARILVLGHYGMKNPKWLTGVTSAQAPYLGYWEQEGWEAAAVPKIFSRFDFPSGSTRLASGRRYLLSGVAWGGLKGIGKVEVSFTGGRTWVAAHLQPPLSAYAWTIWSLSWAPTTGLYTLTVRAHDLTGQVQDSSAQGSFPSGATGYEQIAAIVS
jgi:DMSO/TMAO reductase YedYZ molybdopterin-dependent catalytic subunit